jgi:hypothetical protein
LKKTRIELLADPTSRGPTPARIFGTADWEDAVKAAIYQPRPIAGWPKPTTKKRASKK